uniref:Uncharacterized protein n=1 Tax=Ixodes ricinus TaxID=34613 RepID=A0A6B0UVW3_IXORI
MFLGRAAFFIGTIYTVLTTVTTASFIDASPVAITHKLVGTARRGIFRFPGRAAFFIGTIYTVLTTVTTASFIDTSPVAITCEFIGTALEMVSGILVGGMFNDRTALFVSTVCTVVTTVTSAIFINASPVVITCKLAGTALDTARMVSGI